MGCCGLNCRDFGKRAQEQVGLSSPGIALRELLRTSIARAVKPTSISNANAASG